MRATAPVSVATWSWYPPRPLIERAAHPDERGERRDVAVRALGGAARELVANLCRKGHLPHHLRERSGKAPDIMDGWGFSTREISYDDAPS